MFTGIITNLGKVKQMEKGRLTFGADKKFVSKLKHGDSLAVNGTCLTIEDKNNPTTFTVSVMPETLKKTNLGNLQPNDSVNFELPATMKTYLSGHIVQGHVDTTGQVTNITKDGNSQIITIKIPTDTTRYIVNKGSITINGVSLTVVNVQKNLFTVAIIPYTQTHTMLGNLKVKDRVNIETDILAKHLEKLLKK